jgi:ubiquinone/menaquinone biosynthesis C-methylase UbiE
MSDLLELTGRAEATHFWFHGFRAYMVPQIAALAAGRRDLRLIDCGCGTGFNLGLLQPYGRVFGFDFSHSGVTRTRARGIPVARADLQRIPFADNTFDLATSFDVLQSVPDDTQALREMARILKPGGYVLLNVTAMEWLRGDHSDVWGEQRRYTTEHGAHLLYAAGLQPVRLAYLFGSLVPLMLAVRTGQRLMRLFRRPTGDFDLTVPVAPVNAALTWMVRTEAALARRVPLPVGSSIMIVGRKA